MTRRGPLAAGLGSAVLLLLAACASGEPGGPTPTSAPGPFTRAASTYLLTLDQLRVADFTVDEPPHSVGADAASAGDSQLAVALRAAGLRDGATVRYFRSVSELATANGFLDVRSTVLRFATGGSAHTAFLAEVRHNDAVPHIIPESTDALGDESHAEELNVTSPEGVQLVELTVMMRNANLVELLVVRGRLGGTSLADALILAHRQLASQ